MLAIYGKHEKVNLSKAERNAMARVVPGAYSGLGERSWSKMTKTKDRSGRPLLKKSPTIGARIIEGLEEALAWSKGEEVPVRVTHVQVPDVDVSKVRRRMGLSPTQCVEIRLSAPPRSGIGNRDAFVQIRQPECCWP